MARKPGRKTKYNPSMITKAFQFAENGNTREQIAHNLGISKDTLYHWMQKKKLFSDAIKKGEELAISYVENKMYKRAIGYEYTEIKTITGGTNPRTETTIKEVVPDVTAQIFILKNKKPEEYKDRKEIEVQGKLDLGLTDLCESLNEFERKTEG